MPVLKPPGRSVALVAGVNEGEREGDRTEIVAVTARASAWRQASVLYAIVAPIRFLGLPTRGAQCDCVTDNAAIALNCSIFAA